MAEVSIQILGQTLVVNSDEGADWIRQIAQAVEQRSQAIKTKIRRLTPIDLAIWTALSLAEDLEKLRAQYQKLGTEHQAMLEHIGALSQRLSQSVRENK